MDESRVFNPLDLQLSRSVYPTTNHSMGTCLAGRLIPAFTFNVLPGEEKKMSLRSLFKMATPVYPTMDYLYADISFFFVPYKLVLSRRYASPSTNDAAQSWEGFIGAQDFAINMPIPSEGVTLPLARITIGSSATVAHGNIAEYLYGPDAYNYSVDAGHIYLNCLPELAYFAIWNDNYREPNVQPPVTWNYVTAADGKLYVSPQTSPNICIGHPESYFRHITAGTYGAALAVESSGTIGLLQESCPLPTSIFHGYFGSLLPWPQRNLSGVVLPVGQGFAPLVGHKSAMNPLGNAPKFGGLYNFADIDDSLVTGNTGGNALLVAGKTTDAGANPVLQIAGGSSTSNLGIDLTAASGVDVERFRALIVKQHWYEDIARSGNRLDELEYGTFGVRPKDSGCDRPVYLGGKRIQLNVEMVASTNGGTTSGSAAGTGSLGDLGAFSHTNDDDFYFHAGFDTWGCVQCVFTIRSHNLIASGVDRHWIKETRDDWYWPEFARLGNQATLKAEAMALASASLGVLGYQEYAEEWREPRDLITGLLVPGQSLGFMTYAHYYDTDSGLDLAMLLDASKQWMDIDRTLAVTSQASGFQFIYQFTFESLTRSPVGRDVAPGVSRI